MKTKEVVTFSSLVDGFVDGLKAYGGGDAVAITTRDETVIYYEDWTEHPSIVNGERKVVGGRCEARGTSI